MKTAEQIEVLFRVKSPGDPQHIVFDGGPNLPMVAGFDVVFAKLLCHFLVLQIGRPISDYNDDDDDDDDRDD